MIATYYCLPECDVTWTTTLAPEDGWPSDACPKCGMDIDATDVVPDVNAGATS